MGGNREVSGHFLSEPRSLPCRKGTHQLPLTPFGRKGFQTQEATRAVVSPLTVHLYSTPAELGARYCRAGLGTAPLTQGLHWAHWRGTLCSENSHLQLLRPPMPGKVLERLSDSLLPRRGPQVINGVPDLPSDCWSVLFWGWLWNCPVSISADNPVRN